MRFKLFTYKKCLILVLLCAAFYIQTASAQKVITLSFENIMNALQSTNNDFDSREDLLSYISDRVKVLGVDFRWNEQKENALREAGATSDLIEIIRRESLRDKISKEDSDNANNYYNQGLDYLNVLNYEDAINNFQKAIEINPRLGLAYGGLGLAYYKQKKYEQAIDSYSKAIASSPALAFYLNRGAAYHAAGSYDKAARDYTKVIEQQPKNKTAYLNRGTAYFANNEYQKAITDFEKVLEFDPQNINAQKRIKLCKDQLEKIK